MRCVLETSGLPCLEAIIKMRWKRQDENRIKHLGQSATMRNRDENPIQWQTHMFECNRRGNGKIDVAPQQRSDSCTSANSERGNGLFKRGRYADSNVNSVDVPSVNVTVQFWLTVRGRCAWNSFLLLCRCACECPLGSYQLCRREERWKKKSEKSHKLCEPIWMNWLENMQNMAETYKWIASKNFRRIFLQENSSECTRESLPRKM